MTVAIVNEHGCEESIELGFISLKGTDIEADCLHLRRQLEEDAVASRREDDVHDDEDEKTNTEKERADGH